MPNRSPQGDSINQPTEPMPVWAPPQPGSYERRDASTKHRHDGGRDEIHYQGDLPHYHDDDSGIPVFDPAAEAPNSAATEVDPTPATPAGPGAATPDAALGVASEPALTGGSGGTAGSGRPHQALGVCWCGQQHATMEAVQLNSESSTAGSGQPKRDRKGRFLAKPATPPMSAGLAQALLDADAETWRVDNATRTARVLVYAVEFVDRVRHDGGGVA